MTAAASAPVHAPRRPSWKCRRCEHDWPCPQAKATLLREHERDVAGLAVQLATYYFDAAMDLLTVSPEAPYDRLVSWSRPAPVTRLPPAGPVTTRKALPAEPHRRRPARPRAVGG
ncbi:hypothetical protein [Micromonospora costi]|uniref:Flavin reductase n=1 Tax=Micromonospora costi TaxID=1530042 RepID=A0A3B0A6P7_9ACTN|nr:hypothetical protein [Micromonospora costi]RKN55970.1 hypothetical protein D7193_15400 [Micromonospora costi]